MKRQFVLFIIILVSIFATVGALFVMKNNAKSVMTSALKMESRIMHQQKMERADAQRRFLSTVSVQKSIKPYQDTMHDVMASEITFAYERRMEAIKQEEERKAKEEADRIAAEQATLQQQQNAQQQYYEDTSYQEPVYTESYGSAGRLHIDSAGISVALYYAGNDAGGQAVADAWDSAAYLIISDTVWIADHSNQEFASLTSVYAGASAEIHYADGSVSYLTCIDTAYAERRDDSIYIGDLNWYQIHPSGTIMYTCTSDADHIYMTFWE